MVKVSIVVVTNGGVMNRQKNGAIHFVQGILGIMMAGAFLFFLEKEQQMKNCITQNKKRGEA